LLLEPWATSAQMWRRLGRSPRVVTQTGRRRAGRRHGHDCGADGGVRLVLRPLGKLVDVMRTTVQMEAFASCSDHSASWRYAHDCGADGGVHLELSIMPLVKLVDVMHTTVQKEAFASSCHSVHSASWLTLRASRCELRRSPCCPARRSVQRDNHADVYESPRELFE
jgi:hypothetical protein